MVMNIKKIIVIFFCYIFSPFSFGQEYEPEEFERYYSQAIKDYRASRYNDAIKGWSQAIKVCNSEYERSKSFINIGVCYKLISKYDSAFYFYEKAESILIKLDSTKLLGNVYNNLGTLCLSSGAYKKAQDHLLKALKYKRKEKNFKKIGSTLLNLGELQFKLNNSDAAKDYYLQSLKVRISGADSLGIASCYINLGILEKNMEHFDDAMNYYNKVVQLCQSGFDNDNSMLVIAYENIGELYAVENNLEKAMSYFVLALEKSQNIESQFDIAYCKNEIALIKLQEGDLLSSLDLALDAFNIAKDADILEGKMNYSNSLSMIFENQYDFENAIKWARMHEEYKDSLLNKDKITEIQGLEYEYQTQQKEAEIQKLTIANQKKELETQQQYQYIQWGLAGFVLLLGGSLFVSYRNQKRQKQLELTHQNELLEIQKDLSHLELKNINSQLDPHEIKNILASISPEIQRKAPKAYINLIKLLNITKASIANNNFTEAIAVQVEQIQDYLSLEQMRRTIPFYFTIENMVPEHDIPIPRLLLKNIVENAVKHGINNKDDNAWIKVHIKQEDSYIILSIQDSGKKFNTRKFGTGTGTSSYMKLFEILNKKNPKPAFFYAENTDFGTKVIVKIPANYQYTVMGGITYFVDNYDKFLINLGDNYGKFAILNAKLEGNQLRVEYDYKNGVFKGELKTNGHLIGRYTTASTSGMVDMRFQTDGTSIGKWWTDTGLFRFKDIMSIEKK